MKKMYSVLCVLLLVATSCFFVGCTGQVADETTDESVDLLVYCGAGMREPMEEIAEVYSAQTGNTIDFNFGGSNSLLSQMELVEKGDVYMPGAASYFSTAQEKGFANSSSPICYHIPVIITPKGNPADIQSLEDLGKEGVSVELGDPQACAIGKLSNKIIEKNQLNESIYPNVKTRSGTVTELVMHTALGQVDGSICWGDLVNTDEMDVIFIPNEQNIIKIVPIGSLTFSEHPDEAQGFVDFVASDEGLAIFEKNGFTTYPDAAYADVTP